MPKDQQDFRIAAAVLTMLLSVNSDNMAAFNLRNRAAQHIPTAHRRWPVVRKLGRVPAR